MGILTIIRLTLHIYLLDTGCQDLLCALTGTQLQLAWKLTVQKLAPYQNLQLRLLVTIGCQDFITLRIEE